MDYTTQYQSPLGMITLASDGQALTGLWFSGQKYDCSNLQQPVHDGTELPVLQESVKWLDAYWRGEAPSPTLIPISFKGTAFQKKVWRLLLQIPYGSCITYGELAKRYAAAEGIPSMSAQAVGNAISRNPISILVPCHRVIGTGGNITGYAGGISRKTALLCHEGFLGP